MEIGLALAGVGPGDEVITTPLSWVATANVIVRAGARPVFVDVDPRTRNIDLSRIEAAITPRTRALLPVDLAGPAGRSQRALTRSRAGTACACSKTRRSRWARAGRASASAPSATWCRSAFTPTRTSPPPKAAAWC